MIPSRRPSKVAVQEIESILRNQAAAAMRKPNAPIRTRVIDELRRQPGPVSVETRWPIRIVAIAATCVLAAVVSLLALLEQRAPLDMRSASNTQSSPWTTLVRLTDPPSASLPLNASNPLVQEARLIAKEARQTFALLAHAMPLLPRLEPPPIREAPATEPNQRDGALLQTSDNSNA